MIIRLFATSLVLTLCLLPLTSSAADDGACWQKLKNRLATVTPQKKSTATTAVGGVRGAKDQSADSLYWKDEEKKIEVPEEELNSFNSAYESAVSGKNEDATQKFEGFLKDYPQSALRSDALTALQTLKGAK